METATWRRRAAAAILGGLTALAGLALLAAASAEAGGCRVRVRSHGHGEQVVLLVPSYAASGFAYQVGADLQAQAIAERVAAIVLEKLTAGAASDAGQAGPGESPAGDVPPAGPPSGEGPEGFLLLQRRCGGCHDGSKPERVQLVGADLGCEQRIEAIRRLLIAPSDPGHMPKGGTLTAEELGSLIGYLSGAE